MSAERQLRRCSQKLEHLAPPPSPLSQNLGEKRGFKKVLGGRELIKSHAGAAAKHQLCGAAQFIAHGHGPNRWAAFRSPILRLLKSSCCRLLPAAAKPVALAQHSLTQHVRRRAAANAYLAVTTVRRTPPPHVQPTQNPPTKNLSYSRK
jgi:hypothetical protein